MGEFLFDLPNEHVAKDGRRSDPPARRSRRLDPVVAGSTATLLPEGATMARIRSIKPEIVQSQSLACVSREARLTFVLLITQADDEGRLGGRPRMLASLLFPGDEDVPELIDGWLAELEAVECIRRYRVGPADYIELPKWSAHQRIDHPSPSKLPRFVEGSRGTDEASRKIAPDLDQGSGSGSGSGPRTKDQDRDREQGSQEAPASPPHVSKSHPKGVSNGRAKESKTDMADYEPCDADRTFAIEFGRDPDATADEIHDWASNAIPSKRHRANPCAFWRNWVRRAASGRGSAPGRSVGSPGNGGDRGFTGALIRLARAEPDGVD